MGLPGVYANKIDKKICNNCDCYVSRNNNKKDLLELKSLFDINGFGDRIKVEIETKEGVSLEKLVLHKKDCFVTLDNKKIMYSDIINYKIKK